MSEYNGWTNKPTWLMNIYIDEYGLRQYVDERVKEIINDKKNTLKTSAVHDFLKDELVFTMTDEIDGNTFADAVLGWALAIINYGELALHYIADHYREKRYMETGSYAESP